MQNDQKAKFLVLMSTVIMSATAFAGCFGAPPAPPANLAPFASATVSDNLASVGDTLTFTGQGSDPDGSISTWRWDFGDGTNATGQNATHAYTMHGTFYTTLNVTDNGGSTYDTIATGSPQRVDVLAKFAATTADDQPLAIMSLWNATSVVRPPATLQWGAAGSRNSWNATAANPGAITTYAMDFGDGTTASHPASDLPATWDGNFSHTYSTAGKFVAMLTVTSNTSKTDMAAWTVVVIGTAPPTPGLKNPDTIVIETICCPSSLDPQIAYDDA